LAVSSAFDVESALGESTFLFLSSFAFFILGQIHLGWSNIAFSSFSLYVKIFILPVSYSMVNQKRYNKQLFISVAVFSQKIYFWEGACYSGCWETWKPEES
jgi:hypothetical protein